MFPPVNKSPWLLLGLVLAIATNPGFAQPTPREGNPGFPESEADLNLVPLSPQRADVKPQSVTGDISLVAARWGAFDAWVDVTDRLRAKLRDGRLAIADLNGILKDVEDPHHGSHKSLVVVYQQQGQARLAIVPTTGPTGRGGTLHLPERGPPIDQDPQAVRESLVGTQWRMAANGLTIAFEDGKFSVSDWGHRHGIWMVTGHNRISGVAYDGSHHDFTFDAGLTRGTLAVNGETFSKLTRLPARREKLTIEPHHDLPSGPLFESVLGVYGEAIRGQRHPFITLRPPNRDLWTKAIEVALKGTLAYEQVDYIGTALLIIPKTDLYTIDLPDSGTQLRLNNHLVEAGELKLRKGLYHVEIYTNHWGQPYLKYAHAAVLLRGTKTQIPFVNTGTAIERHYSQLIDGQKVTEVCAYNARQIKPPRQRRGNRQQAENRE